MKNCNRYLVIAAIVFIIFSITGCFAEKNNNYLYKSDALYKKVSSMVGKINSIVGDARSKSSYDEAVSAFGKGEEALKFSYSEAVPFYEKALELLEEIKDKYPSSTAAVKIANNEAVLGYYTYERLKDFYLPDWRKRGRAEADLFNCSLFMAEGNAGRLAEVALKYAGIDNVKAEAAAELALENAKLIADQFQKDSNLERIITVYMKTGEYDKASRTAEVMSENGWAETVVLFGEAAQFDQCEYFINKLNDSKRRIPLHIKYAEMAAARGMQETAAGVIDMALDLLDQVDDETLVASVLKDAAILYAQAGKFDRAREIAERIRDPLTKCTAFNKIALNSIRQGQSAEGKYLLNKALAMAGTGGRQGRAMMLAEEIASSYIEAGEYNKALEVLTDNFKDTQHIVLYEYKSLNFSLLAEVVIKSGADGYKDLSDRAFIKLLEFTGFDKSEGTGDGDLLNYVVIPLAKGGGMEKAEKAAELIRDHPAKAGAYAEIAGRYIEAGNKENAAKAAEKAYTHAQAGGQDDPGQLICIAGMFNDLGRTDEAENILDTAVKQVAGMETGDARAWMAESSALLYCKMGLHQKGVELADFPEFEDWRRDAILENISKYYAENGQIPLVTETIERIRLPHIKGRVYTHLAEEYVKLQKEAEALGMLEKALEEVSISIDADGNYFNEIPELFAIAEKYAALQKKDKADSALLKALEAVGLIRERNSRAWFLADIDVKYIQTGVQAGAKEKEILHMLVESV